MAKIKALFLDRDDTIIKNIPYMNDYKLIEYLPGVFEKVKMMQDKGYKVFIITNQSGISRSLITYEQLDKIHFEIRKRFREEGIEIVKFFISPYKQDHYRRKPGPGLLFEAAEEFNIDLENSIMIGDGDRDVDAGKNAGLKTCFKINDIYTFWPEFTFN